MSNPAVRTLAMPWQVSSVTALHHHRTDGQVVLQYMHLNRLGAPAIESEYFDGMNVRDHVGTLPDKTAAAMACSRASRSSLLKRFDEGRAGLCRGWPRRQV